MVAVIAPALNFAIGLLGTMGVMLVSELAGYGLGRGVILIDGARVGVCVYGWFFCVGWFMVGLLAFAFCFSIPRLCDALLARFGMGGKVGLPF